MESLTNFITTHWSSLLAVHGFIAITLTVALFLNFSTVRQMFFGGLSTRSFPWPLFRALNWISSLLFVITSTQLTTTHMQMKNGLHETLVYDKLTLFVCFTSLTYLIGFFSVAAVLVEEDQGENTVGVLIMPMVYFTVASVTLVTVENSMISKGLIGTSCVMIVSILLQAIKHASSTRLSRDGNDFDNTLLGTTRILSNSDSTLSHDRVAACVAGYENLYDGARSEVGQISTEESVNVRKNEYKLMVDSFYDLVTDFYEYGWGQSFHFARRFQGEDFIASIARAEHFLALKLHLNTGMKCLDMGCGVGGPMRAIARFSGAEVKGITLNEYQVKVANRYNKEKGLADRCHVVQGDFMNMPFEDNSFDAVYAIESTCHAPDKAKCFAEAYRVLKPGGLFVGYEWVMIRKYDSSNPKHVALKEGIEVGNGLPTIASPEEVVDGLKSAGFEVQEHFDTNDGHLNPMEIPWYDSLMGRMTLKGFRMTRMGRICTHTLVTVLELLKIAPKGSVKVSQMLNDTADDLVEAGKMDIFTPDYFFLAKKPLN